MQKTLFLFTMMLWAGLAFGQNPCGLVSLTPDYPCVDTFKNVQYGQGKHDYFFPDPGNGCAPWEPLHTDIFRPCVSNTQPRPLIVFIHGGGFSAGNKTDFWKQCGDFAQRGYVTATIQYRLSINILTLNRQDFIRAGYRAQQDAKAAIRFFRANAETYGIDTSNIYLLGYSAGAVTALNLVYARDEAEKPAECGAVASCGEWFGCPFCPDLGPLEGEGGNEGFSSKVKGVYSMAGAVMDLAMVDAGDDVPIFMIHGTADQTVDYDSACFLNLFPCPKLYGSHSIQQRAEALGLCTFLHTVPGGSHDLSPQTDTIVAQAGLFFKGLVCDGSPCAVSGYEEEKGQLSLKLFPNPATDRLTLMLPKPDMGQLVLTDFWGRNVWQQVFENPVTDTQVPLDGLSSGMYFLTWRSLENGERGVVKVVVGGG